MSRPADRPTALFIDHPGAAPASTTVWRRALSEAGVPTTTLTSPEQAAPVVIGRGDGASVAFRQLLTASAAGAILIDPEVPHTARSHGPLLLLVSSPWPDIAALQAGGICDRLLEPGLEGRVADERVRDLAEYIHGWLVFHRLLGP